MVYVKEEMKRNDLQEQAVIGLLWSCLMNAVEWNKKEELVTEQALKHLKVPRLQRCSPKEVFCLNTFCHLTAVTVTLTCMSLGVGSSKANQFIHSVGVDIHSIIVFLPVQIAHNLHSKFRALLLALFTVTSLFCYFITVSMSLH